MIYKVGECIDKYKGHIEGSVFDIDSSGAHLIIFFASPSKYEISQFQRGVKFKISFYKYMSVLLLMFKFGSLNWMDAPYSPHLSNNLDLQPIERGSNQGLSLQVTLVDSNTGMICAIRLIGLSNDFSLALESSIKEEMARCFNREIYAEELSRLYTHSTDELTTYADNIFILNC